MKIGNLEAQAVLILLALFSEAGHSATLPAVNNQSVNTNISESTFLSCYDCSEISKHVYYPFTDCQLNPPKAPLRECLSSDLYCMVERVTVKRMTVSIHRGCTFKCDYGCRYYGFAVSQLRCTSCCQTPGCNTGSNAVKTFPLSLVRILTLEFLVISSYYISIS